jgi:hypothetical protein
MNGKRDATRRMARLGVALLAIVLPACNGTRPWSRGPAVGARRIAYKPIPTSLRGRPFYVSGYGGADYSPSRPRQRQPVNGASAYGMMAPAAAVPPAVSVRQGTWDEP